MFNDKSIWMGGRDTKVNLLLNKANRHGLITGASGSGKTVSLKVLAEGFSAAGVPVFMADIKGDLAGMCQEGIDSENMQQRINNKFGIDNWQYQSFPTAFWDVFGQKGLFLRATISDMGPLLLSKLMNLSDVQEEVLNCIFKIADDNGLLLIDMKDLKAMLKYVGENKDLFVSDYGNLSPQSIASIQRNLVSLETLGADNFFTEPMLDIQDIFRVDENGKGFINILHSVELAQNKTLYSTFMLWLMSELYENMPEVGDLDKPKAVFFFDEAHMLFNEAPKVLVDKVEQVVRLIRSKGIGIYFISQSPADIPEKVLAQLGNKIQHVLRAYTPKEQKAIKAVADSFRPNPSFRTEDVLVELGTGEALVSFLDDSGAPGLVERVFILPPQSKMGTIDDLTRNGVINNDPLCDKYIQTIDNISAYEKLNEAAGIITGGAGTMEDGLAGSFPRTENLGNPAGVNAGAFSPQQETLTDRQAAKREADRLKNLERQEALKAKSNKGVNSAVSRIAGNTVAAAGRGVARQVFGSRNSLAGGVASTLMGSVGREAGKSLVRGIFGSLK